MRSAGIPIESLIEYVRLFALGRQTVAARKAILLEERKNLADRIAQMQEVLSRLDYKISRYDEILLQKEESLAQSISGQEQGESA